MVEGRDLDWTVKASFSERKILEMTPKNGGMGSQSCQELLGEYSSGCKGLEVGQIQDFEEEKVYHCIEVRLGNCRA